VLQNRYGDRTFPVRARWSDLRAIRLAMRSVDPNRAALRGVLWVLPALVVLAVMVPAFDVFGPSTSGPEDVGFLITLGVFIVLAAAGILVGSLVDRRIPRREQEAYWRLSGIGPVTDRQQQLLALDAQSDYAIGGWNSTLDYGPAAHRLPLAERSRPSRRGPRPRFVTMPLFATGDLRARLDNDQQIASGRDTELFVADAFGDASLSARFHRVLHGEQGERMLGRLSSLTGLSEWDLRELDEPLGGRPPLLLWGADSQRVISIVRMAHLADHVDAATAWRLIERAAEPAEGLFGSWDAYWANVRIGVAFFSDRLEAVQAFDDSLAGLRGSAWPAARVPFPSRPVPAWLPRFEGTEGRPIDER
jgi:hypothetical protein